MKKKTEKLRNISAKAILTKYDPKDIICNGLDILDLIPNWKNCTDCGDDNEVKFRFVYYWKSSCEIQCYCEDCFIDSLAGSDRIISSAKYTISKKELFKIVKHCYLSKIKEYIENLGDFLGEEEFFKFIKTTYDEHLIKEIIE